MEKKIKRRHDAAALTADELRGLMHYDAETGVFTNTKRRARSKSWIGTRPGHVGAQGYRFIGIGGNKHLEHRLAWLYVHGEWPPGILDHINRDKTDNRMANLRLAPHALNVQNQVAPLSTNKLGVRGVAPAKGGLYRSQIMAAGVLRHLGLFKTIGEAKAAYDAAAQKYHVDAVIA